MKAQYNFKALTTNVIIFYLKEQTL